MRRYPLVLGATAAGLAAILSFHSSSPAFTLPSAQANGTGGSARTSTPPTASPTTGTGPPQGSSSGASTTTTSPPVTTTTAPATVSATGAAEHYGYGVISVRVTVSDTNITAVTVVSLQTAESYSQELAQQAIPVLRREVLSAQSAKISAVSGATYTSQAYAASVQSALDSLHL